MRKLIVGKNDSAAALLEKIEAEVAPEIVLVIPKNSILKESVSNFDLLARSAREAQKRLSVESVDEEILALARASHLDANHPLFSGDSGPRPLADILPRTRASGDEMELKASKKKGKKGISINLPVGSDSENSSPAIQPGVPSWSRESQPKINPASPRVIAPSLADSSEEGSEAPRRSFFARPKFWLWLFALVVLTGIGAWVATVFFGKVTVNINLRKAQFENDSVILASKSATSVNAGEKSIPAELFTDRKNTTQLFSASGRAKVNQKASGQITIYNAYNSKPQVLVATTRFETPDGKIFRLSEQVTVPGAQVADGKITPASVIATVTADGAGPSYNVGKVDKLTIPGFKGTPRYDAFYGSLPQGTSNGFIGERGVPTDKDIAAAKTKTSDILTSDLKNDVLSNRPAGYKILDEATNIVIIKLTVNATTNDQGQFSVLGEATYQALGFREDDLKKFYLAGVPSQPVQVFETLGLSYKNVKPNFTQGTVQFEVVAKGVLRPDFSPDGFKQEILGIDVSQAQSKTGKVPGLSDAKLSLWPIWLSTVPSDPKRVIIVTN